MLTNALLKRKHKRNENSDLIAHKKSADKGLKRHNEVSLFHKGKDTDPFTYREQINNGQRKNFHLYNTENAN